MTNTAGDVIAALREIADPNEIPRVARFYRGGPESEVLGVPMPKVFPLAKRFRDLSLAEVDALLDDPHYEVRMAAVSILDFKARRKIGDAERKALYELYLRCHDRLNNWDFVDRAAPSVVGEYLIDEDRRVLDRLARSADPSERRTAIVATYAFIKRGETGDTFRIAEMLAGDPDPYVQKAVASWVREAGKRDQAALVEFLTRHKTTLPRPTMTAAAKGLPEEIRVQLRS